MPRIPRPSFRVLVMKYTQRCGIGVWFTRLTTSHGQADDVNNVSGCGCVVRVMQHHNTKFNKAEYYVGSSRLELNWYPLSLVINFSR